MESIYYCYKFIEDIRRSNILFQIFIVTIFTNLLFPISEEKSPFVEKHILLNISIKIKNFIKIGPVFYDCFYYYLNITNITTIIY